MLSIQRRIALLLVTVASFTSLLVSNITYAAANSISVSAPSTVSSSSQTFVATIMADLGTSPIPVVDAYVSYDASKIEFVGIDYAGSPYTADTIDTTSGSGFYKISRFTTTQPFPTDSALIAKVTFRPKVTSGSTQISVDKPSSALLTTEGNDVLISTESSAVTFVEAVTPTKPAPVLTQNTPQSTTPNTNTTTQNSTPKQNNQTPAAPAATPPTQPIEEVASTTTPVSDDGTPLPATLGVSETVQRTYESSKAVSFFARTPVRVTILSLVAVCIILALYIVYIRTKNKRLQQQAYSPAFPTASNPTQDGIMVEYGPAVVEPNQSQNNNGIGQ